jgi:hypothetical protein
MFIFAVNHGREGESVLLFSHDLGTDSLNFMEKFSHPLIKTPNQVTAAGPRYEVLLDTLLCVATQR